MSLQEFLDKMKLIEQNMLEYIENEDNCKSDNEKFSQFLHQNYDDADSLEKILLLLSKIANNHHRSPNFFQNIFTIFLMVKDDLINYLNSEQVFKIFYENKRIILFLIQNAIINIDPNLATLMISPKYSIYHYQEYLYPELKKVLPKIQQYKEYNKDEHEKKICLGENDHFICNLIRNDSIEDFISHVTHKNISLLSTIEPSIFETNSFLIFNQPSLIEYAAFFGSIQIVRYMQMNGVIFDTDLWNFSIHSQNPELIHLLEENGVKPEQGFIKSFIKESLKCHHNAITQYLIDNYSIQNSIEKNVFLSCIQYYNFAFFPTNFTDKFVFYDLCAYNYQKIVKSVLENEKIDVNYQIIHQKVFLNHVSKQIFFECHFKIYFFFYCDPRGLPLNSPEIFLAIDNENVEIVRKLLDNYDVNRMSVFIYNDFL